MVDRAFADVAALIDPQSKKYGCSTRPSSEHVARKIAPIEHRGCQMGRLGNTIVTAAANSVPARSAASPVPGTACPRARSGDDCFPLGRLDALARCRARRDLRNRRNDDPRLRGRDCGRLAPDVGGRRSPLLLLRSRRRPIPWWRRWRRWQRIEVEYSKHAIGAREFAFAVEVQKDEQECQVDGDHRGDGAASIPDADARSVGHALSTPAIGHLLRPKKERRAEGTARR